MRKQSHGAPCRTLSAEERTEVERQLRAQGRLQLKEVELVKLRNARRLRGESAAVSAQRARP
jgi:hypothetical protein